eukprot:GHVS01029349.1.p1 GENE.GHVS01029349.1~~GHVS01029349.1.p1  ORF type:complete len:343 (+),score=40.61 GHVS01029349.1:123-1151(+)
MPSTVITDEGGLVPSAISWFVESMDGGSATFIGGFVSSFFAIVCSELGDKTFIIAALLSMKHSHFVVFSGAIGALTLMTVLSAVVGYALPALLSREYTHCAATLLFFVFGIKLLFEAWRMGADKGLDEIREVEAELKKTEEGPDSSALSAELVECKSVQTLSPTHSSSPHASPKSFPSSPEIVPQVALHLAERSDTLEGGQMSPTSCRQGARGHKVVLRSKSEVENTTGAAYSDRMRKGSTGGKGIFRGVLGKFFGPVFLQSFTLTFLAEWGDRSQIATIALAASKEPVGVVLGGTIGHALCTGVAVIGGRMIASSISEKTVTYTGGLLFLLFATMGVVWGV